MSKTTNLVAGLTATQRIALGKLSARRFETAADIGAAGSTLTSLVKLGLADRRTFVSSLREPDLGLYRISGRGCVALGMLRRSSEMLQG